jgi:hypothetical protein
MITTFGLAMEVIIASFASPNYTWAGWRLRSIVEASAPAMRLPQVVPLMQKEDLPPAGRALVVRQAYREGFR